MVDFNANSFELNFKNHQNNDALNYGFAVHGWPTFKQTLQKHKALPLKPQLPEILQINVGYTCNQTCAHCHVNAGPQRKEQMSRQTFTWCLEALQKHPFKTVDLTGGAPEMNKHFTWFVEQLAHLNIEIIVRSNLTILVANKQFRKMPEFFAQNKVQVISSLPFFTAHRTNKQRGNGVFEKSVEALKILNQLGYGKANTGLLLHLVYNPVGAYLPDNQLALQHLFKTELKNKYNIEFNKLLTITNLPISRYLDYLISSSNYETYIQTLINSFNVETLNGLMCKNTISVDYLGNLYDCDFNQMLGIPINSTNRHIKNFNLTDVLQREIALGQHCYGCTAGAGSSCQGATT